MLNAAIKLTFLLALGIAGYAQKSDEPIHNLKPRNYWGISIIPSLAAKTEFDGDKDMYDVHSHPNIGAEMLIQFHCNLKKNYSLIFGLGLNSFSSTFHYNIPKDMLDPPTDANVTPNKFHFNGLQIGSGKVQAELLRRWPRNKVHNWDLAAGLSLLFTFENGGGWTGHVVEDPNGQTKQYLTFYHPSNNNGGKPWFNFHFSGGHEWILKSKNIFQLNAKLNYSPINPSTGTYIFTTGIQPDLSGTYSISGSYIGLSIAYILTAVNFRIKDKN